MTATRRTLTRDARAALARAAVGPRRTLDAVERLRGDTEKPTTS
ncbi:hypothetical protein [Streptomyces sp. TRM68367]|nr:hypothetical protein [Streptomyces sp. TRM68367]